MPRRERPSRKTKSVLTFYCEGETEAVLVNLLAQEFKLKPEIHLGNKPNKIIRQVQRGKGQQTPNDKNLFIFDGDDVNLLDKLQNKVNAENKELLISTPCIELWFLLHYQQQSGNVTTDKCIKLLKQKYQNYTKGKIDGDLQKTLCDEEKRQKATDRAKRLESNQDNPLPNPSTKAFRIFEILEEQSR